MDKATEIIKGILNGIHWNKIFPEAPNYVVEADGWFERMFGNRLLDGVEISLPYITTIAMMGFAVMLMVTGDNHKYMGRIMLTFWLGVALKMIL